MNYKYPENLIKLDSNVFPIFLPQQNKYLSEKFFIWNGCLFLSKIKKKIEKKNISLKLFLFLIKPIYYLSILSRVSPNKVFIYENILYIIIGVRVYRRDNKKWFYIGKMYGSPAINFHIKDNKIIYGVYTKNKNKMCPQIRSFDFTNGQDTLIKRFSFGRHIHSVVFDKYESTYYIALGDDNYESAIIELDKFFNFKDYISSGLEDSRVISIEFTKDIILIATDKPCGENYLYSYQKKNKKFKKLCSISGPVYSSCKNKSNFYFISSIEDKIIHKSQLINFNIEQNKITSLKITRDSSFSALFFNYEKYYLYNLENNLVVFKRNI